MIFNIAEDFTKFPTGRSRSDSQYSGESLRVDYLVPLLQLGPDLTVQLDGTVGYGSSFLEEAFGGLVKHGMPPCVLREQLTIETSDASLSIEIWRYIDAAGRCDVSCGYCE